jgi:predicted dehydrogenase
VTAHLDHVRLPEGRTDAGFVLQLRHVSGVLSVVESSKLNRLASRELRAYGSAGSYRWSGVDVQAQAVFSGRRPVDDPETWGYDPHRGVLATAEGERGVPSAQGRYHDFYTEFAAAVRGLGEQPVPALEGIATLAVLDAARASAETGTNVELPDVAGP